MYAVMQPGPVDLQMAQPLSLMNCPLVNGKLEGKDKSLCSLAFPLYQQVFYSPSSPVAAMRNIMFLLFVCFVKLLYFSESTEDTSSNLVVRRAKNMDQEHKESSETKGKFLSVGWTSLQK